jgi:hypothetical protein
VIDVSRPIAIESLLPPLAAILLHRLSIAIIRPRRGGGYTPTMLTNQTSRSLAAARWTDTTARPGAGFLA